MSLRKVSKPIPAKSAKPAPSDEFETDLPEDVVDESDPFADAEDELVFADDSETVDPDDDEKAASADERATIGGDDEEEDPDAEEGSDDEEGETSTGSAVVARGDRADKIAERSYAANRRRPTVALKDQQQGGTPVVVRLRDPHDYALIRVHLFKSGVSKFKGNWTSMLCAGSSCYLCAKNLNAMDSYVYEVINRTGYVSKKNGAPVRIKNIPSTLELRQAWHRRIKEMAKLHDLSKRDIQLTRSGKDLVIVAGKPSVNPDDKNIPRLNIETLYVPPTKDMMKRAYSQLIV